MGNAPREALDQARKDAGLSPEQLWLRYFALGGMCQALELDAIMHGALTTTTHDRDVVVHALNERFSELGRNHPVAYSEDPDPEPDSRPVG